MDSTSKSVLGHLLEKKLIDLDTANKVRVEQSKTKNSEENILLAMKAVSDEDIVKSKSEMFNIPYIDLATVGLPADLISGLNIKALSSLKVMPFEISENEVKVAMLNPFDVQAIQSLKIQLKKNVPFKIYITSATSLDLVHNKLLGQTITSEVSRALEDVDEVITDLDKEGVDSISSEDLGGAPVARIVNSILQYAIEVGASDVHMEPMEDRLRVRFRIDGVMSEKLSLPRSTIESVVARTKILSSLKLDEKRVPQDGRIQIKSKGKKIDMRVSTMPTIYDEKIVLRLLDVSEGIPQLESSGLRGQGFDDFVNAIKATNGIILITGPTGSGKTRTLSAAIGRINRPDVNIITLENPVEIRIPGVTQVHINPDAGLTFAKGLRAVLRQDPDIVMVGEIRDQETADLAVEASLTGHLVLATLHTNSAAAAIARLIEMGVESYLLASTLKCVVAQRLPRRICKHCIEAYIPPVEVIQDIHQAMSSIPNFDIFGYADSLCKAPKDENSVSHLKCPVVDNQGKKFIYLYKGKGCEECNGTGYSGRVALFEVLIATEEMGPMMLQDALSIEYEKIAMKNGMLKMMQDGYLRSLEGVTTIDEVLRVTKE